MIEAIIFDVGGVLIRTENGSSRRSWEKKLGLAAGESERIVFNSEFGQKAQRGEISDRQLWRNIGERLNLSPNELDAFRQAFWADDVLDTALVEFIRGLRPRYQTAVISNATDALRKDLTEKHGIIDAFELIVCSAEENVMKPDAEIYVRTLERLRRKPFEAIFIDDFIENVAAAREVGMHAIHFQPTMDVATELSKLGVT